MKPRKLARISGEKTYSTGEPCRNDHVAPRYTSTGGCTECLRLANEAQSVINQSLVRKRNGEAFKDPELYASTFPLEWHDSLNRLRQVILFGTDDSKDTLRGLLRVAFDLELARAPVAIATHSVHLTRVDLDRFFTFGPNGMPDNVSDYPVTRDLGTGTEYSGVQLDDNWYEVEHLLALINGTAHRISPSIPPAGYLP